MGDPFRIEGPALISFSGGRTSAYMLWRILQAHGGVLPDDVHVVFANTGKEREETLRFVRECGARWGVKVRWLEWRCRLKRTPLEQRFEEVGLNSAARRGEPFAALIASKRALPNAVQRRCTEHLKMQVCADFMEAQGYSHWSNVIGLRRDEVSRVATKDRQNEAGNLPWVNCWPLFKADIVKSDVLEFWLGDGSELPQGFDLGLAGWEGNCTLCFMKGRKLLEHLIRLNPKETHWWSDLETSVGATFTTEYSYSELARSVRRSPLLPMGGDFDEFDAECGVSGADRHIRCGARREAA
jgi:3'-phosphoadenosine 5'-phosphosulfate sulfotransferase (PAPS reductase)/FAD synthetase